MICPACRQDTAQAGELCPKCSSQFNSKTFLDGQTVRDSIPANPSRYVTGSAHDGSLAIGHVICDRYEVLRLLGSGGMGCVYQVMDRDLDRIVALKTIRPQFANDPSVVRRFKQEILLARQITHRNVIRIFDFGSDADMRFITMEFFEGEDLRTRVERCGKFAAAEAIPIVCQMCEGLASAHAEGVVHRDLKPQNVLVNANNEVRILDFGLAHFYEGPGSATMQGGLAGTPDYMSPEQAKGEPLDARSDLYSAGLVFYEMLTGTLPFRGESVVARLVARTQERPQPLSVAYPDVPLQVSKIVSRCLERERARRYASAAEILHDLSAVSDLKGKPGGGRKLQRLDTPRRKAFAAGLVLLCASAAAGSWFWYQKSARVRSQPLEGALTAEPYVAVLPLSTRDPAVAPVADGLRESMLSRLLSARGVHPVAAAAVDKANLTKPEEDIAQQLGANLLVRGSVSEEAGRLAVKLTAFDARKKSVVWSDKFTGGRNDLLTLENTVTSRLLSGLQLQSSGGAPTQPTQNMEAYDLYLQGRTALKEKRNDAAESQKALASFEQAINKDPSFALAWTGVADASMNLYRLKHGSVDAERAVDAARRASQSSDLPEVHLAAGSVYTQAGRQDEAISEIRRALQVQPNSDDAYVRLGRAYLETGQTGAVIQALQNAVRLNPYYWYNQEQLARAYFRVGLDDEALAAFRKLAELSPDSASAHLGIAGVLVRQGKWDASIPEYKKSIALKPTPLAYTSLGTALFYLRRYAEALPNFQKAAQQQQHDPLVLANLGSAYRQLGQHAKAEAAFRSAIAAAYERLSLNPRDAMMLGSQALLHAYVGETAQSLSFIEKARAIDASSNELMYDEAVVRALAGPAYRETAVAALKKAVANGYSLDEARHDPDLESLKNEREFQALVNVAPN